MIGLDNFNSYYDLDLKRSRQLTLESEGIEVIQADVCNTTLLKDLIFRFHISHVVHLAAQAGVRHSLVNPNDYISSNLEGFVSILEACRTCLHVNLIYASSSSVYGINEKIPFSEEDPTDFPANLYGATKKSNEVMAHAYHHLYGLSITALRYFTVYGPWGRPDMAYYRFSNLICEGKPIQVFNRGIMRRDFTYIDDIVRGTAAAIDLGAACETFNLGNNRPINLLYLIELLEKTLEKKAIKHLLPAQPGEVNETYADIEKSRRMLGFDPKVQLEEGIAQFVKWFKAYHTIDRQGAQPHKVAK